MTTATRTHRTPGLSAEQRRARQDELLATLADGVLELTTSDGWRRYLRAMATLRTYSSGNSCMSEHRECLGRNWRTSIATDRVVMPWSTTTWSPVGFCADGRQPRRASCDWPRPSLLRMFDTCVPTVRSVTPRCSPIC